MVSTTVEKSNSRVYCVTASRSKSSSRGSGCRAFSSKARVMTDNGVPEAKRSKRGSNSMAGSLEGSGGTTQATYQFGLDWWIRALSGRGDHLSTAFPFPQEGRSQAVAATVKFLIVSLNLILLAFFIYNTFGHALTPSGGSSIS